MIRFGTFFILSVFLFLYQHDLSHYNSLKHVPFEANSKSWFEAKWQEFQLLDLIRKDPANSGLFYKLASFYFKRAWFEKGLHCVHQAHLLNPKDQNTLVLYTSLLVRKNKGMLDQKARKLLKALEQLDPENKAAFNLKAIDAFYNKKYKQAIQYWQQARSKLQSHEKEAQLMLDRLIHMAQQKGQGQKNFELKLDN